jgi:2-keto-3-deoxy-6-phosphogluconate aldolase
VGAENGIIGSFGCILKGGVCTMEITQHPLDASKVAVDKYECCLIGCGDVLKRSSVVVKSIMCIPDYVKRSRP